MRAFLPVEIRCPGPSAHGARFVVDGHDLSSSIRSLKLEMRAGQINRLWIEVLPGSVDAQVLADLQEVASGPRQHDRPATCPSCGQIAEASTAPYECVDGQYVGFACRCGHVFRIRVEPWSTSHPEE